MQAFPMWGMVALIVLVALSCAAVLLYQRLGRQAVTKDVFLRDEGSHVGGDRRPSGARDQGARVRRATAAARRRIGVARYSDRGGRDVNEDTCDYALDEGTLVAVVADGLGGHGGGDIASRSATERIIDRWRMTCDVQELRDILEEASALVHELGEQGPEMRTTAVVLSFSRGRALWANAGDSRLYHFVDSRLVWQTQDHSVSQMAVMMGEISPQEIRFHEDRSRLTKVLGQEGPLKPDVGELALDAHADNAFLLCTDGFWEYVLEDEMEGELAGATSPSDWLRRMRRIHDERCPEDCDNNSAIACWLIGREAEK